MKKFFVVLVSILTFGLVTPSYASQLEHEDLDKDKKQGAIEEKQLIQDNANDSVDDSIEEDNIQNLIKQGEMATYEKLGDRILPVIEEEFRTIILPKMEEAIYAFSENLDEEVISSLRITEEPSKGTSERIFHLYSEKENKDLIRFHVRRDRPPGEGYWFNFHYHTFQDRFETHYSLGDIYWDKNTPPDWMKSN